MHRVAFRVHHGGIQSAVLNHTVNAGSTRAGVRWYEVQRDPATGAWTINQQSTYALADSLHRWMGSVAQDRMGNIAAGYSVVLSDNANGYVIADAIELVPLTGPGLYTLTVNVVGSGSVTKTPNQALYSSGALVTLTATPAAGFAFIGWSGALTGTANPATISAVGP